MTHASYGYESADTYAWIENAPEHAPVSGAGKAGRPRGFVVAMPRYQEFTTVASQVAGEAGAVVEIAGNGRIALTLIGPRSWTYAQPDCGTLFSDDIQASQDADRRDMSGGVARQGAERSHGAEHIQIRRIYDY